MVNSNQSGNIYWPAVYPPSAATRYGYWLGVISKLTEATTLDDRHSTSKRIELATLEGWQFTKPVPRAVDFKLLSMVLTNINLGQITVDSAHRGGFGRLWQIALGLVRS